CLALYRRGRCHSASARGTVARFLTQSDGGDYSMADNRIAPPWGGYAALTVWAVDSPQSIAGARVMGIAVPTYRGRFSQMGRRCMAWEIGVKPMRTRHCNR